MLNKAIVRCKKCGSIQNVDSEKCFECPNGCYNIKLSSSGNSYRYYKDDAHSDCINIEYKSIELEEDDYLKFDYELIELINKLKKYKDWESKRENLTGEYYIHSSFHKNRYDKKILDSIHMEIESYLQNQRNTIVLNLYFVNEYKYRNDRKEYNDKKLIEAKYRIKKFLNLLNNIENGEINIKNRKQLNDISWEYINEIPTGATNNEYYM